ncbi:uncharacterized protein LOC106714286 isoform X2 [Papilio machaon]|uniref:uncharacterized protein LOC106714286 isoform X2 n=1 Tax=Papilio machaon TaxID=76193 RepID=UPI001E662EBF|nr:uncharacterized protein LOC106714286 isoform X2 [Papilio machaon]
MVKESRVCAHVGFLFMTFYVIAVNGYIEIVEEQRCHNTKIRLTCRDLDAHIAVLEAWYTSIQDYQVNSNVTRTEEVNIKTENDTELDKVYVYASPMHNGVYELVNNTGSDNITDFDNTSVSDVTNEVYGLNDTVEVLMEFFNASEMCSVLTYSRRYSILNVNEKRRDPIVKGSAVNLQAPLGNRCNGASHCSFILKKTHPPAADWSHGIVHVKYSCLDEIVEEQRCYDSEIRLTCRELDSHIAILEAWYTSLEDYKLDLNASDNYTIKTENDLELDRVYVYSSPKHNGVYELTNHSIDVSEVNDTRVTEVNDTMDTVDMRVEFVNGSDVCNLLSYTRSYASWHDGGRRRRPLARPTSINLRPPLSYRCTGVNHCNFLLEEDYPPAVAWPPGVVSIKYACFDDSLAVHYCNREVFVAASGPDSEGYIRTPGYPHFYVGDECRWRLKADPEQRIQISILDVSLRSIGPFEDQCTDFVSVVDSNGESLLSTCEQVDLPLRLTSTTDALEVIVEAKSQGAFPKRGVLLHYKSLGCVTLPAPSDGYLVYRNEDVAHYMCNVNFVFADTRQRARMIWCFEDNRWNGTIPLCIETTIKVVGNDSVSEGPDKDTKLPHNEANMIVDIVIPSLLIAALFIGNAFIVLIIYKYRKRKTEDLEDEFNTIPLNVNGMHSAGNAV